jgi:hypothetical protein
MEFTETDAAYLAAEHDETYGDPDHGHATLAEQHVADTKEALLTHSSLQEIKARREKSENECLRHPCVSEVRT